MTVYKSDDLHQMRVLSGTRPSRLSLTEARSGITAHERLLMQEKRGPAPIKARGGGFYLAKVRSAPRGMDVWTGKSWVDAGEGFGGVSGISKAKLYDTQSDAEADLKKAQAALGEHVIHEADQYTWYANAGARKSSKPQFHLAAGDWIRSGKAVCGADIRNPGFTIRTADLTDLPKGPRRFCKKCLKKMGVMEGKSLKDKLKDAEKHAKMDPKSGWKKHAAKIRAKLKGEDVEPVEEELKGPFTVEIQNKALGKVLYRGTFETEAEAEDYAKQEAKRSRKFAVYTVWQGTPRNPKKVVGKPHEGQH